VYAICLRNIHKYTVDYNLTYWWGDECINCKQNWYNENYSVYINMYIYQFIFAVQMII